MDVPIELIVGLGNPGPDYESTRHNAGFWFVDAVARAAGASLRADAKFHGDVGKAQIEGRSVWLLKPMTYMNRSGLSAAALAHYYKLPVESILVAHDELDLAPGTVKLKQGGGHAGHNGLRDLHKAFGGNGYMRLRIGIGHPGDKSQVVNYVLHKPSREDQAQIEDAIDAAVQAVPLLLSGDDQRAFQMLHSRD